MKISDRINKMAISQTLAMSAKVRGLKRDGIDLVNLSLGEPDFDVPNFIKEAAKKAIDENFSHYPPVNGFLELREAISNKFKRDNNLNYSPDQIIVSTGAKQSISNAIMAIINPGDEVIVPAPFWVSYIEIIKLAGGIPIIIESDIENEFLITPESLEKNLNSKTKAILFSNPCNPSGSLFGQSELEKIGDILSNYPNVFVISDEIYEHINFTDDKFSIGSIKSISDRVITINGLSKSFAMTGWRLGYMGAPIEIAKACNKFQGQSTSGANAVAQRAAIEALKAPVSSIQYMIDEFEERRKMVYDRLSNINGIKTIMPKGAFYFFVDVSELFGKSYSNFNLSNSEDVAMYFLEEAKVATVQGSAFGNDKCIRISYASSKEDLIKAMDSIEKSVGLLS